MNPTQEQYNTTLQRYRNLDIRIEVLNFNLDLLDEISGITTQIDISIDADSDIRRTATVNMILKSDYTRTSNTGAMLQSRSVYWQGGNSYWFDKLIKIFVSIQDMTTGQQVWVNQGVYMINAPSISYDSSNNSLNFQAVDMMAKLTGMRNGYLEGIQYSIPANSTITSVMKDVLKEAGIIQTTLFTPPEAKTPYDINIDIGSTVYDLLSELRDINPNWEMFFNEEGIFIFQEIPSGNVNDPNTGGTAMLQPVVTPTIWEQTQSGYSLSTDFEQVKNYVEVLGKFHEPNKTTNKTELITGSDTLRVITDLTSTDRGVYILQVGFNLNSDATKPPVKLSYPITKVEIVYTDNTKDIINLTEKGYEPIWYENTYYLFRIGSDEDLNFYKDYLGGVQSYGVAWENNPESPFYVGSFINDSNDVSNYRDPVYGNPVRVDPYINRPDTDYYEYSNTILRTKFFTRFGLEVDATPIITKSVFDNAPIGTRWKLAAKTPSIMPYNYKEIILRYSNGRLSDNLQLFTENFTNNKKTSLAIKDSIFTIEVKKIGNGTETGANNFELVDMRFPNIEASMVDKNYTSDIVNPPKFTNQVRYVCSGDEYDNIYSNDLATQRAKYEIYLRSRLHDSITITTVPIYWLGVNEVIQYNVSNEVDINGKQIPSYWLTKNIETSLSANGTQSITAIRYYPLYPSV